MKAGYSSMASFKKLGIREELKVLLIAQPQNYFDLLEKDISSQYCKKTETPDFIHLFVEIYKDFESQMKMIKRKMKPTTVIWVSWYKKVQESIQISLKM